MIRNLLLPVVDGVVAHRRPLGDSHRASSARPKFDHPLKNLNATRSIGRQIKRKRRA